MIRTPPEDPSRDIADTAPTETGSPGARTDTAASVEARLGAEQALRRAIEEAVPVGLVAIDADRRIVHVNRTFCAMTGWSREEILGAQPPFPHWPPEHEESLRRVLERAMAGKRSPAGVEIVFRRRDGSHFHARATLRPVEDPPGEPTRWLATITDTTAEKRTLADLSEHRRDRAELAHLREAVAASGEVIFITDRDGVFTYINPEFTRVYGYDAAEVVGQATPRILKSGVQGVEVYRSFWRTILSGEIVRGELVNRARDGRLLNVDGSANPIRGESGEIIGFLAIQRDVTQRREEEAELRLKNFVIDHASDSVFWVSPDGTVVDVNEQACRSLGYARAELLGMNVADIDGEPGGWDETWSRLKAQKKVIIDRFHRTRDGRRIPVEVSTNYVSYGGREYAVGFARDVNERLQLAAQLQQAQRMEAVGRLAGGVAHDFNNLLSVILSYSSIISEALSPNDPILADLQEIQNAAERAATVARQLLTFSRKQVVNPRVLDLNAVISGMERLLRRAIGEDLQLVTAPAAELWLVRADPGQIEQVLVNLAVNARDAMPEGGQLTISTANHPLGPERPPAYIDLEPGRYVKLSIRDEGTGMSEEVAARIFEPFYTTKPQGKGSGLGLSIVYGIIKQAGGGILVESQRGRGTTFEILLPVTAASREEIASNETPLPLDGRGETILLVEDEDVVRTLASRVLLRRGYRVLEARNAGEALIICERRSEPVDLLLTDVVMPQMSGKELADRLHHWWPELRILYMSGYPGDVLGRMIDQSTQLLEKPFSPADLANRVREALEK